MFCVDLNLLILLVVLQSGSKETPQFQEGSHLKKKFLYCNVPGCVLDLRLSPLTAFLAIEFYQHGAMGSADVFIDNVFLGRMIGYVKYSADSWLPAGAGFSFSTIYRFPEDLVLNRTAADVKIIVNPATGEIPNSAFQITGVVFG